MAKGGRDGVKVIEDKTVQIGPDTWNYLEYSIDIDGMVFRYSNYYTSIGDKGSIQVLFFTLDTVFETYRKDMERSRIPWRSFIDRRPCFPQFLRMSPEVYDVPGATDRV